MADTRKVRTERSAENYKSKTEIEHVLTRPDTYIGSIEKEPREELLLNLNEKKLFHGTITIPQGLERLFLEILSNAGDNADNSRRANVDPDSIDIYMDKNWIKIRNGGLAIPVEESKEFGKLVPEAVFGMFRTSSNYDDDVILMGCGRNGFGAKLTNIYSKMFVVTIGDNVNKKLYKGVWENNMQSGPKSEVKPYTGKAGYVEVAWLLDFERFGYTEYPDEAFNLFGRHAADFSLTCKVPVNFQVGETTIALDLRNIREYAKLRYSAEQCESAIIHYEWPGRDRENPNGICPFPTQNGSAKERSVALANKAEHIPMIEMMILDTPDNGTCLSYVNGMYTMEGGVHVNEAMTVLSHEIAEIINNLNKSKKDKDAKMPRLNQDDIKKHLSIILNCRLPDPKYASQSKTRLTSPKVTIKVPEKIINEIKKWNLIDNLILALEAKMHTALKKTNGGRVKHIALDSGEDANEAGTDKSENCVLYLVEGKSAAAYPKKRIVMSEGGKDLGGYYPLRGKFMNVRNANLLKVADNKEVKAIKTMLGLREGVDYTRPENLATLRYGYVMICVDADSDGFHIASLLINYFNQFYAGLLQTGRISILRTPVVRITDSRDKILHRFYNNHEFEEWEKQAKANGTIKNCKITYYKGLGRSDDHEIKDDLTTAPVVMVLYDDQAQNSLTLAFDKDCADRRKEWIAKWREVSSIYDIDFIGTGIFRQQYLTSFINRELIDYTKDALFRAIPSQDDGLKRSHRQALFAALKYFCYGRKAEMLGVSKFANYAASETNYHHGEMSMCATVVNMTQDYTGSNNLPWFKPKGQFGTRSALGEDSASPRYISVGLPKYASLLYDEELINCIPRRCVDAEEVEPLFVPAAIPMHLVNGVIGIATGYSTYIPSFNYYELLEWCKDRCVNKAPNMSTVFKPWFRGFKGKVLMGKGVASSDDLSSPEMKTLEDAEPKTMDEELDMTEDDAKKVKGEGTWFKTKGLYKIGKNKEKADLIVTEIPIGMSIIKYRKWLEMLVKTKVISDFRDKSTTEVPYFEIKGYNLKGNPDPEIAKNIHLEKSATLNNITLIDHEGYPTKYNNLCIVLEIYAQRMISLYEKVKNSRLETLRSKMEDLKFKIQFIQAVIDDKIKIVKRPKKDILADMGKQKPAIPERYLKSVRAEEFSNDEVEDSKKEYAKLEELHKKTLELEPEGIWLERLKDLEAYLKKEKY